MLYVWTVLYDAPVATCTLIALGILLHYTRRADRRGPGDRHPADAALVPAGVRRQTRLDRAAAVVILAGLLLSALPSVAIPPLPALVPYLAPLVAAIVAILLIGVAAGRTGASVPPHEADAAHPRSTLVPAWQVAIVFTFAGFLVATLLGAGALASDDEDGRSAALAIRLGSATGSTTFPGWYYGVPMLAALLCLAAAVLVALRQIARRSAVTEPDADRWLQRIRARTVLTLAGGATVVTLGLTWSFIAGASSLRTGVRSADGYITVGTSIAALEAPLRVLATACEGVGLALVLVPLFAAVPALRARSTRTPAVR